MKKLILILLCLPMIGFGQGWEQTFGGAGADYGCSVQQTNDGGYIITGCRDCYGDTLGDVYLIKTDGSGIEQWNRTFGGAYNDVGYSVQQTTDGGYIITGETNLQDTLGDVYLIKTDGSGIEQWSNTFGGIDFDIGRSVQQTTDGGYIITGETESFGNGNYDIYLVKTDANGVSQWNKTFGGLYNDRGESVQQTTDGGYIITGYSSSFGNGGAEIFLIKTNSNGDSLWTKIYGTLSTVSIGTSVQQTNDGGYIIIGITYDLIGNYDIYLVKTDGSGIEQWNRTFGGAYNDAGYSVQQTTDGGYIITGCRGCYGDTLGDVYLIKTDGSGIEQWNRTFGGAYNDVGYSVQQTTDGGYIITGATYSFGNGNTDVYLIKTDGSGNITSTFNIPINPNRKLEKVVDILGKETKPQTNTPFIEIYDDGTVEKRIVIE